MARQLRVLFSISTCFPRQNSLFSDEKKTNFSGLNVDKRIQIYFNVLFLKYTSKADSKDFGTGFKMGRNLYWQNTFKTFARHWNLSRTSDCTCSSFYSRLTRFPSTTCFRLPIFIKSLLKVPLTFLILKQKSDLSCAISVLCKIFLETAHFTFKVIGRY